MTSVEKQQAIAEKALAKISSIRKRRKIVCSCGDAHAICELELLVTHWYVEPHGCSGGDYWREGEWQFTCLKDGTRNRLLFMDDYKIAYEKRERIGEAAQPTFKHIYRGLFKSRKDVHERNETYSFVNNYYVDKHRAKFELPQP